MKADGGQEQQHPIGREDISADPGVDALGRTLDLLNAPEGGASTALAEMLRLVRVMENQPAHALGKLKSALDRAREMTETEKLRLLSLRRQGLTEAALRQLRRDERERVEGRVAEDIRLHFGLPHPPAPRYERRSRLR